ncbi:thioredoxin domain-containing protein [Bacillus thuringiensis]|uniref:thioredoxin domain-containing protein n=1 Tax=Bacillus thuringiensis TaxID=1428 RepID=UPI000A3BF6B5|nr:thioredoxin domain-containing protein [Bacillus thuringiensis]OUA65203.1 hypothetical protein BK781_03195 [Bacillus thuringiensis serovar aizawai]
MKKTFLIFSILAIVFGGVGFYFMSNVQEKKVVHKAKSHTSLTAQINIENQPIIGDPNAPVTMVEFFDLKCPFCLEWKKEIFPKLKEKYIDTNKAKIVFINAPLKQHGKDAYLGALALEAAYKQNPDASISLIDELFSYQKDVDKEWLTKDLIAKGASKINNLDVNKLMKDIEDEQVKQAVEKDRNIARESHLNSTPTLFINNVRVESIVDDNGKEINSNPFDLNKIDSMIKEELEKK